MYLGWGLNWILNWITQLGTDLVFPCSLSSGGPSSGHSFEPVAAILLFSCALALHARQVDIRLRLDYLWAVQASWALFISFGGRSCGVSGALGVGWRGTGTAGLGAAGQDHSGCWDIRYPLSLSDSRRSALESACRAEQGSCGPISS